MLTKMTSFNGKARWLKNGITWGPAKSKAMSPVQKVNEAEEITYLFTHCIYYRLYESYIWYSINKMFLTETSLRGC